MLSESRRRKQQAYVKALAGPVVLEDHGEANFLGSIGNVVATDHGNRVGSRDSKCLEGFVLSNLRELELEGTLAVDHHTAVALEPSQHGPRELGGVAMAASVRGGTHTIVEEAVGRCHREMEHTFIEEPFAEWYSEERQLAAQRLDPGVILMDHEDTRRSDTREMLYFHEPSRMRIRRVRYSSQHRPKRPRKEDFAHARKGTKSAGRLPRTIPGRPRRGARSSLSSNRLSCFRFLSRPEPRLANPHLGVLPRALI